MTARKKKPLSGYAKMKASGKKAVLLTLSPSDHLVLTQAAKIEQRPLAQFVRAAAVKRACIIIRDADDFPQSP